MAVYERSPRTTATIDHPSALSQPFSYEANRNTVVGTLQEWGFGQQMEYLTPEGLNRPRYISFARQQLGIPEKGPLPKRIGEVNIPPTLQEKAASTNAYIISFNTGLGHLRVATSLGNALEVLGGEWTNAYLGSEKDVLPKFGIFNPNELIRSIAKRFSASSMDIARRQGMHHEEAKGYLQRVTPVYDGAVSTLAWLGAKINHLDNPNQLFEANDIGTLQSRGTENKFFWTLRFIFTRAIKEWQRKSPEKDHIVLSTHFLSTRLIGRGSEKKRNSLPAGVNIATDSVAQFAVYEPTIPNFVPSPEAARKWSLQLGLPEGQEIPGVTVTEGFPAPLASFKRGELTKKRQEAVERGEPVTVIATASGVAKAQLGAFTSFIKASQQQIADGKMRMVIQCGSDEGGGKEVYDVLQKEIARLEEAGAKGLTENIVLHVAKTPQAAIDMFEALSWSPTPIAMLVKGSEMACISPVLNIPLIVTGAIGSHEFWNIALGLKNQEGLFTIQPGIADILITSLQESWNKDPLIKAHPEFMQETIQRIQDSSTTDGQDVLQRIQAYIRSGKLASTHPEAMLTILNDTIAHTARREQSPSAIPTSTF